MFALDTNLIVRFLVEDDVAQSGRAAKLVSKAIDRSEQLFVSDIVMCEGEHARTAGCERVATFDRALLKEDHFAAP
jgi:predicted nucleic-acid-binding protein